MRTDKFCKIHSGVDRTHDSVAHGERRGRVACTACRSTRERRQGGREADIQGEFASRPVSIRQFLSRSICSVAGRDGRAAQHAGEAEAGEGEARELLQAILGSTSKVEI